MNDTVTAAAHRLTSGTSDKSHKGFLYRTVSRWRFIALVQAFDYVIFVAISFHWLWSISYSDNRNWWLIHIMVSLAAATTANRVFQSFRLYEFDTLTDMAKSTLLALFASVILAAPMTAELLMQPGLTTGVVYSAHGLTIAGLLLVAVVRLPLARLASNWQQRGIVSSRYFLIGDTRSAINSVRLELERSSKNRVIGSLILPERNKSLDMTFAGVLEFIRKNPVEAIVLILPLSQPQRVADAVRVLRCVPRQILLAPTYDRTDRVLLSPDMIGCVEPGAAARPIFIKISDRPLAGWRWMLKDAQDRLIALILLIILFPIMISIASAIFLADPGPVFFVQKRRGYGGATFDIIKYRTMRVVQDIPDFRKVLKLTIRDDPRIFPVGRFLRRTSLDEIPQLLNVLKGDMWLVGPRPHSPLARAGGQIYADAVKDYGARYRLKPGITGWAQVSGWRGPTVTVEQLKRRVECDLYYVENWSVWFDFKILLKTLCCAFGHENAF